MLKKRNNALVSIGGITTTKEKNQTRETKIRTHGTKQDAAYGYV
jgi:hypothetical protein